MQFDLTRPNTGRIVDYWLGGNHNFEIDRHLAEQISQAYPFIRRLAIDARRQIKWCAQSMYARGLRVLIDFGSSLPTTENAHIVAHEIDPAIRVVYSDIDPVTAAYGQELTRAVPNVIYLQADATDPSTVLDSPLTRGLIGDERRVGFTFFGLAQLMTDAQLRSSLRTLYGWAAPGSCLGMYVASEHWNTDPDFAAVVDMYRRSNLASVFRGPDDLGPLLLPWSLTTEGMQPNTAWTNPESVSPDRVFAYRMLLYK